MSRIVLAGGSGQIGRVLGRAFGAKGNDVVVLSRGGGGDDAARITWGRVVAWDGRTPGDWAREIDGADLLINLAGRSVNCRYHARNRAQMVDSRVDSTRVLGEAVAAAAKPPRVWLNSSTATIYRHEFDRPMDEATGVLGGDEPGAPETWNFSIEVAKAWEAAFWAAPARDGMRKVAMRSSMVMSPDRGGVFDTILGLVRVGLGGANGSGRQFVSWIHDADFVAAVKWIAAHEELDGIVNVCAPNPLPNREFMRAIRRAWGAPIGLPATAWMIEIGAFLMRTESELVLKSRRVVPRRLLDSGFVHRFPTFPPAAADLCARVRVGKR